ncbi:MAG: universal stress protein [Chloroflexi bacterium]|jgi:nucleotide-binding universal stress UspA family protein|nr:universal stress protein [Chloroflexota bacterium]
MLNKVLIPLDGSANAEKIAGWSEGLAEAFDSDFILLMVVDPDKIDRSGEGAGRDRPARDSHPQDAAKGADESTVGVAFGGVITGAPTAPQTEDRSGYGTQMIEQVAQRANAYVNDVANRLSSRGFKVRAMVTIGKPEEEILKVAEEENVDVITMSTHRESLIARGVLGSVTDRVVTRSTIPVLAVRPEGVSETMPVKPEVVVVPLDGSEVSESVVPLASTIAAKMGAELLFVRVSNMAYHAAMGDAGIYYASPVSYSRASDMAAEYLEPFVEQAKTAGVAATMRTPTGSPAATLIAIAEENDNTMIVIGTRGQSGFKRLVVGSVADKVLRTSGHPVLVVPPVAS